MWGAFSRKKKRIFTSEKEFNSLELKHQEKVFIFLIGNKLNWLQFHSLHALLSHRKEVHKNVNYLNYCTHISCLLNQCNFNWAEKIIGLDYFNNLTTFLLTVKQLQV